MEKPKKCDICKKALDPEEDFIDGKTIFGPWAWMCKVCHEFAGIGFGLGKGQLYDGKTLEKKRG